MPRAPAPRSPQRLKSVDFYRKLPTDLTEATLSGATISIVTTLLILFLLGAVRSQLGSLARWPSAGIAVLQLTDSSPWRSVPRAADVQTASTASRLPRSAPGGCPPPLPSPLPSHHPPPI